MGAKDLGVRKDVIAAPLLHDTAEAMATPREVEYLLHKNEGRA